MTAELTDREKVRRLPWLYAHSGANSAFSGLTWFGPVFVLFLSELGLPKTRIGILLSFLPFAGIVALLIAPAVARAGVKRVFVVCWTLRKVVTAGLLFTPWVLDRFGPGATFAFLVALMALFAALRAVGETAWYPWFQEIVPPSMRGRMQGINNIVALLASSAAMLGASWVLGHGQGLTRFLVLIAVGVAFGLLCAALALKVPGGAPGRLRETAHWQALREALADGRLRSYLAYTALCLVTMQAFGAFVPLFMKEEVGLPGSRVVLLEVAAAAVGVPSAYAWGRWADRTGSRPLPVALALLASLPVLWSLAPRQHALSFAAVVAIACLAGSATTGWWVTDQRLLFVDVVPTERRTHYLALYYAWIGFVGGCAPLVTGALLDGAAGLRGRLGPLHVDPYTPLFAAMLASLSVAALLLARLRRQLTALRSASPGGRDEHDR